MSQITRCPHCATTFKVVADQLRISDGWVRCGHCKEVFDASEHLLVTEHQPLLPEMPLPDPHAPTPPVVHTPDSVHVWGSAREAVAGDAGLPADPASSHDPIPLSSLLKQESPAEPQAETEEPRGYELPGAPQDDSGWPQDAADAAHSQPLPLPREQEVAGADGGVDTDDAPAEQPEQPTPEPLQSEPLLAEEAALMPALALPDAALAALETEAAVPEEPGFVAAARRKAFWRRPVVRGLLVLVCLVAALALALQMVLQERDVIAARNPRAHSLLEQLCQPLGCTVQAPRRIDAVVIDSSSFVKARHDGASYELHMGIKNNAAFAVAMPALELTLTDAQDQTLLRRVLLPDELGAPARLAPGATWSSSVPLQVLQDASHVAGYRLLAFYP